MADARFQEAILQCKSYGNESETKKIKQKRSFSGHKTTTIRSHASYFELFKPSTIEDGMNISSLFCLVQASFPDDPWYSNFRVTRGTFLYTLHEICEDISRQDTLIKKAVTPNR